MEETERRKIRKLMENDVKLRRLYKEHSAMERELLSLENRNFLTSAEEIRKKQLKQKKLYGVELMLRLMKLSERSSNVGEVKNFDLPEAQASDDFARQGQDLRI